MHVPLGWLRDAIRRLGYEVVPSPLARLLRHHAPTVVLDVGANEGQFGLSVRKAGFTGRIVSFEPIASVFAHLAKAAASDPAWEVHHTGLGDRDQTETLHVASNTASSSLLAPGEALREHASFIEFKDTEEVTVARLDTLFSDLVSPGDVVALKVDTQGYEQAVLNGAESVLDRINTVFLELSLVPLYDQEPPAETIIAWMRERGFVPAYLAPAFTEDGTRRWLQSDVLFVREDRA
ncbi:MAG: FkbM family methyltransferase [Rubricoccaceae bacterium]